MQANALKADPERIAAMYRDGRPIDEIAQQQGIGVRTVQRWLERLGVGEWRRKPLPLPDDSPVKRTALRLVREQVPPAWVAETTGLSAYAVRALRRRHNIPRDEDWPSVRLQIQARQELFDLHQEFQPAMKYLR